MLRDKETNQVNTKLIDTDLIQHQYIECVMVGITKMACGKWFSAYGNRMLYWHARNWGGFGKEYGCVTGNGHGFGIRPSQDAGPY